MGNLKRYTRWDLWMDWNVDVAAKLLMHLVTFPEVF